MHGLLLMALGLLTLAAYRLGRRRAFGLVGGRASALHSRPGYYGSYVALWCGLPSLVLMLIWVSLEPVVLEQAVLSQAPEQVREQPEARQQLFWSDVRSLASGNVASREDDPSLERAAERYRELRTLSDRALLATVLAMAVGCLAWARGRVSPDLRARNRVEQALSGLLLLCSAVAVLTTVGIVLSLVFEAARFFSRVSPFEFLFGLQWSPQTALRADQVGSSGAFGAIPVFAGTLLVTAIAMAVAVPVGLMSAIHLSEYATPRVRRVAKPLLEVLAGIPTVVYGFFAALVVAPVVRDAGEALGLEVASESALAAGSVMGIMIIPFVSSLSDDVISSVPMSLREGSYALGATTSETIRKVVLPAALPGIVGAVLLAVSRAVGETMIVVMAAGLAANLTANPLDAVTTVTVQVVTLLVGDQEFDSAKTLAAFALGLVLFLVTLTLNVIALSVVRRYRERYD